MNWTAISAIGQVLGTIAVLVTLVYLALQVRLQRSESRRALSQSRVEALRDLIAMELEKENTSLRLKADTALESKPSDLHKLLMEEAGLTEYEARKVLLLEVAYWNYRVNVITSIADLSSPERTSFDGSLRARYGQSGVSRLIYKKGWKVTSHPEIIRYIDDAIAAPT